ncbi:hypothetical protein IHE45_10G001000 [Dioscorea alata]|uniref:Uncharacterized protein n=1 Tax=Dioscorea alata TaxID=55571 RepID=A0ACB7V8Y1_DIOAL|nr:hypothetical protein IHE45_10G001000 [Dioscorea alata]
MSSNWVVDIQKKMNDVNPSKELALWSKQSIYKVPACIKDLNPKAYKPQIISLGPYHHGDTHLLPMEEHKQRALLHFLKRSSNKALDECMAAMEEVEPQLRASYQGLEGRWNNKDLFLQLMIVDGCFMLEVLRVATGHHSAADYVSNDPIFSNHGMLYTVPYIKRDMLMLENQIPLLVLEKLLTIETGTPPNEDHINKLVLKFFSTEVRVPTMPLGLHPLDVFRKSLLQGPTIKSSSQKDHMSSEIIRSAMELDESGIRFRTSKSNSLRDIQFRHGILYLPVIVVDDATEFMFLNLMAFERLHVNAGNEVTAYVFFMDNIIDSAKDVSLLNSKGIIQNALGSDKAVAKLFNSLSKDVVLDPESTLDDVHLMVNKYCRKSWNMWRANLIHTYFRSPWAFLSLVAAIFLIFLTVAQTFYAIYPYYVPSQDSSPAPPAMFAPPPA